MNPMTSNAGARSCRTWARCWWWAALLALAPSRSPAQAPAAPSDTAVLAAALVRAQVPATDDPDAVVRDLITTGLRCPHSPAACALLEEAKDRLGEVLDPAAIRALLPDPAGDERLHGRLRQRVRELRWLLLRPERGLRDAGRPPLSGYSHELLVSGPFGDDGDHFVGVVFPPELQFPVDGRALPGRGGPATLRTVRSEPLSDYLYLLDLGAPRPGCYYGLQRYTAEAATDAFLELELLGDLQLFVDGREVRRVERAQQTARRHHYVPLHLPAGDHTVLVKTCSNDVQRLTLRFVTADGSPATTIRQLPIEGAVPMASAPASVREDTFLSAGLVLQRAALAEPAQPELALAAAHRALRDGDADGALALLEPLRRQPPAEPSLELALASLLDRAPLPDEIRTAAARASIERAAPALLPDHHHARLQQVALLEQQDQREQALRLLADHPRPGPATWSRRWQLLRQLQFEAELTPLLLAWQRALPADPEPLRRLADAAIAAGDHGGALALLQQARALRRDQPGVPATMLRTAIAVGDWSAAAAAIDDLEPVFDDTPSHRRRWLQLSVAEARGQQQEAHDLREALLRHAEVDAEGLLRLAGQALAAGDREQTIALLQQSLVRRADQPAVHEWLAMLGEPAPPAAALTAHRRSGDEAIAAFQADQRERGAASTVLIDQRLVAFAADGSWTAETHQLRRINDQAGVERFGERLGIGQAAEVLLVRTRSPDGKDYVPARIDDDYSLQQLQPGAFVEWRLREHGRAPGPNALATDAHFFGAADEPCALSELVLRLPASMRGELRTRGLGAPDQARTLADGARELVWTRRDVAQLPQERFPPPLFDLLPVAQVGEDDPPFMAHRERRVWLLERTRPTAPLLAAAAELFTGAPDDRTRVERAHTFCQQQIEAGPGDDALDTLLRKKGSRFLLTVALLRAGGVAVVPMAASEVRPELQEDEPSLFRGGNPLPVPGAAVTLGGGEHVFLFVDTPRHWPLGAIPAQRRGTEARLLHAHGDEVVTLPWSPHAVQTLQVRGKAVVQDRQLRLEATATIPDVQGLTMAERVRELKDNVQKQAARQIAQQLFPGWRVDTATIAKTAPGAPFTLQATLTRAGVQPDGANFVIPLPLPPDRFVASYGDRAERTLPLSFPGDLLADWQIELDPGEALQARGLPVPTALRFGPLSFEQGFATDGRTVTCRRLVRLQGGTLPAARFQDWLRTLAAADQAEQATIELAPR
jgi:tetratricopeptide (TPR) repeat protein